MNTQEIWKDIKGCEGYYQVSDFGRIRSLDRITTHYKLKTLVEAKRKGRILSLYLYPDKYLYVTLSFDNERNCRPVHKFVAETFLQDNFDGVVVTHLDGNKLNNHLTNLKFCTFLEFREGSQNKNSKLNEIEIPLIRSRIKNGEKGSQIARDYEVSPSTISLIKSGKSWKHVN